LLAGGSAVSALTHERASADKRKQSKAVTDQRRLNHAEVAGHGWRLAESFMDNDRSASRHAKKARPDFERLIEAIESGRGDVLVMREMARRQRDLAVYVQIRDLCLRSGLFFWSLGGSLYDLRERVDRMSLSFQAVQSEDQAEYIRDNVLRGVEGAALSGRPPGALAQYSRLYDQKTPALLAQSPDTEPSIHHLDMIRYLTGRDIDTATAPTANPAGSSFRGDCIGGALVTLDGGGFALYEASLLAAGTESRWRNEYYRLEYRDGAITCDGPTVTVARDRNVRVHHVPDKDMFTGHRTLVRAFADWIDGGPAI